MYFGGAHDEQYDAVLALKAILTTCHSQCRFFSRRERKCFVSSLLVARCSSCFVALCSGLFNSLQSRHSSATRVREQAHDLHN